MQLEYEQKLDVFTQLIEHSTDAVIIWAPKGGIIFWNRGAQLLYGYTEEEAINFSGVNLLKPVYPTSQEDVHGMLASEGHWQGDIHEVTKDGERVIVSARFQSITVEGLPVILAINRDVTNEREQVQQLRTQARLLELSPDAIIVTLPEEGVSFWNEGAQRLYGYTQDEVMGNVLKDLLKSDYSILPDELISVLKRDGEWQGDVVERTKAGQKIIVSSSIQSYEQDGLTYYLMVNRDVTADRALQNDLLTLNRDLVASNRELDGFAYIASHDLKEPIRGIAINADILLREDLSEKAQARVRRMGVLCDRIDQLISDLRSFSQLGRSSKARVQIDLNQTLNATGVLSRELLSDSQGVITLDTQLPLVNAELNKIKTVFSNLIDNGLTYNESDTRTVNIGFLPTVNHDGTTLENVFYVRDNGIGIDAKNHEKIFKIFKRLHAEADFGFGTGAGLSFVKKIIEGYGGKITVVSQLGEGTSFYFTLPLDEEIS